MKKLSIIIPAYNEENRIAETLLDVSQTMAGQPFDCEILVVNDGSKDNTVGVVENLKKQIPNLRLIGNSQNRGKGFVVKQGMLSAGGDILLFMDADNSTRAEEIFGMLPYFEKGFDLVIGSRRLSDSKIVVKQNLARDFLGFIFRAIVSVFVPLGLSDSQCGFKVFTRKAAEIIFPKQTVFRWAFDVEKLVPALRPKPAGRCRKKAKKK